MKHIEEYLWLIPIAIIFGPWVVGFVDIAWIFFTGHVITGVPWAENDYWRVAAAVFWPFAIAAMATMFVG